MTFYKLKSLNNNNNWGSCESAHGEKFLIKLGDIFTKCDSKHHNCPQFRHLKSNKIFCVSWDHVNDRFEEL